MSFEFTITCQGVTQEEAKELMNARPGVEVQFRSDSDDWRVSYGFGPDVYLDLMWLEEFNSEPNWTNHLEQMRAYVQAHESDPRKAAEVLQAIGGSKFALVVLAEPDLAKSDPRKDAIAEWAEKFEGILTTSEGLFGADLQPLVVAASKPWWKFW